MASPIIYLYSFDQIWFIAIVKEQCERDDSH